MKKFLLLVAACFCCAYIGYNVRDGRLGAERSADGTVSVHAR